VAERVEIVGGFLPVAPFANRAVVRDIVGAAIAKRDDVVSFPLV
jgi:hypothetical protein